MWYDVKRAKTGYLPAQTRLFKTDGKVANTAEIPNLLADYFEKRLWGVHHPVPDFIKHGFRQQNQP